MVINYFLIYKKKILFYKNTFRARAIDNYSKVAKVVEPKKKKVKEM